MCLDEWEDNREGCAYPWPSDYCIWQTVQEDCPKQHTIGQKCNEGNSLINFEPCLTFLLRTWIRSDARVSFFFSEPVTTGVFMEKLISRALLITLAATAFTLKYCSIRIREP